MRRTTSAGRTMLGYRLERCPGMLAQARGGVTPGNGPGGAELRQSALERLDDLGELRLVGE